MDIKRLFSEPDRSWNAKTGATEAEISALIASARVVLPVEYLDLLRYCNGGEGPLDLPPQWFALYSSLECIELFHSDQHLLADFPDLVFFGTNGGLETIGFDLGTAYPWRIVMVDAIAGSSSCTEIAADISTFIPRIGIATT
jgi:SMI1 / KNR4 family (SUKH-1)